MSIRRSMLSSEITHYKTVQSGNTTDSAVIAHFTTDRQRTINSLKVEVPYSATEINSIEVTACGVNILQCDSYTNGTVRDLQYAATRNSDGEILFVHVAGTANGGNCFRNLNYINGQLRWPPDGTYATFSYDDDSFIRFVGMNKSPTTNAGISVPTDGKSWQVYNLRYTSDIGNSTWVRINMTPESCTDKAFDSTVYPMVCLAQDQGCAYKPYQGITYTITLPSGFYGGTVDIIEGTVTATYDASGTLLTQPNISSITPIQLQTLNGVNNIWSKNGSVTVSIEYSNMRLIEYVGNPAIFTTRIEKPIEDLYATIVPTLGGSGSPAPDNVLPISSYTEITFNVNGDTITVPCPTIPGTDSKRVFYGAELNLATGILHATHWGYSTSSLDAASRVTSISTIGSYTRFWIVNNVSPGERKAGTVPICGALPVNPNVGYDNYSTQSLRLGVHDNYRWSYWLIMPTSLVGTTAESIFNYLKANPILIVFERADTAGNYTIQKPVITPIKGENTITSNINGTMSFKYWTH